MNDLDFIKSRLDEDESTNTTTEETTTVEETKPEETVVENEQPQENTAPVETPTPAPAPTPAPKTYSEEEYNQMVYSFKRQLGKQKDSFTSKLNDSDKRYEEIVKRLGALENPEKPLTRDQFASDDEFIDKLIDAGVEKRWAAKEEQMRAEYEKYQQQQQEEYEQRKELDEGINKWYPTAEERNNWKNTVENAFGQGLKDLLEQEQNVMNYLFQTPNQSLILYKFATDKDAVTNVFSIKNPLMRLMAVRDLENELVRERNTPKQVPPTPAPVQTNEQVEPAKPVNNLAKPVGKPGTQIEAEPDLFDNTDALREALRGM